MSAQLTQFVITQQYADGSPRCSVDVDVVANTLHVSVDDQMLIAKPCDINWLIEALTKAKKLIEGEQA